MDLKKLAFILLLLSGFAGCTKSPKKSETNIVRVQTTEAKKVWMRKIELRGIVEPAAGTNMRARYDGQLEMLRAGGENIRTGEYIGTLKLKKGKISVKSPRSGILWNVHTSGQVKKGDLLFSVHPPGKYEISLDIPEALRKKVYSGMPADIELPLVFGNRARGSLYKRGKSEYRVSFGFPPRIAEYLSARVYLYPRSYALYKVPRDAISSPDGERKFLYVLEDGQSMRREIIPAEFSGSDDILVHADLKNGEKIIISPIQKLANNMKVEALP